MLSIGMEVRRAFEEDEFFPVFQPVVELGTGKLAGFEALARWNHARLGAVSPDDFIPVIERSGYIDELTKVMLRKAFASTALSGCSVTLSINISPHQLLGSRLCERIANAAEDGHFSLDRLTIEITESALVDDLARAQAVARDLKAIGCKLALDDFGTGYSSLKHLDALPFDELKIDRSFVSSMTENRESRKIVASVVGLGQSLDMLTVAEGVETQEQANILFGMGCNLGQGWLYGRGATAEELPGILESGPRIAAVALPSPWDGAHIDRLETLPAQRLSQLQAIYDGAPVGLCFLDRNMRYLSLNRRLAEMNGNAAEAHLGRTPEEMIPGHFREVRPFILRALEGEALAGVEILKPGRNGGKDITLMASYQPVRDEANEVIGVSVAVMDVTERKSIEDALHESNSHHRHTLELTPHILWVLNAQGEVTEAGPHWEQLTGMPMEEAFGNGWLKALHPDDVPPTIAAIDATLLTGQPIDIVYRVRRAGEPWQRIRSRGTARLGPSGEVVRVYGDLELIEEQRQKAEALERAQAELQAILDEANAGVILAEGPDGRVSSINPEADRIFEGAVQVGQTVLDYDWGLIDSDGNAVSREMHPLARAIATGEVPGPAVIRRRRRDGSMRNLRWRARPILLADGRVAGGVMVAWETAGEK